MNESKNQKFGEPAIPLVVPVSTSFPMWNRRCPFFCEGGAGLVCSLLVSLRCDFRTSAAIVGPQAGSLVAR
jgi:hypothetical protein